ncbi:hypothetical protein Dimus_010529 [Dionaea muscipula]
MNTPTTAMKGELMDERAQPHAEHGRRPSMIAAKHAVRPSSRHAQPRPSLRPADLLPRSEHLKAEHEEGLSMGVGRAQHLHNEHNDDNPTDEEVSSMWSTSNRGAWVSPRLGIFTGYRTQPLVCKLYRVGLLVPKPEINVGEYGRRLTQEPLGISPTKSLYFGLNPHYLDPTQEEYS